MDASAVYADATALIGLARINRLDLLDVLNSPILVTNEVWNEIASDPGKEGYLAILNAREHRLFRVVNEGDGGAFPELGAGESSVISAASRNHSGVLIDDLQARKAIEQDDALRRSIPRTIGLVGLILLAKRRNRIAAATPILDALIAQNFRIGRKLYEQAVQQAGEE